MPLLDVRDLSKRFGGLAAVSSLNFSVETGEIVGLIGPNGAGKTTCFNLLSGFLSPTSGSVVFAGEDITGRRPHEIVARGLVRTFQHTTLFQDLSVLENVLLGLHLHSRAGLRQLLFSRRVFPPDEVSLSREVLEFTGLAAEADQLARNLPHGHQRVLGIAMALAARPRLLLLDEPVTGMKLEESARVMSLVKTIRDRGTTILLVEHNMKAVMGTCERIVVLNFGQKLAEGTPADVSANASVIENLKMGAYLRTRKSGVASTFAMIYEHFPILRERGRQLAGSLSGGEQQMLAIARALMTRPKLLLLDEPSMGLSPIMTAEIGKVIRQINALDVSIILVEQNAMLALTLAQYGYVLETGTLVMQGKAEELLRDEGVKKAYLGI